VQGESVSSCSFLYDLQIPLVPPGAPRLGTPRGTRPCLAARASCAAPATECGNKARSIAEIVKAHNKGQTFCADALNRHAVIAVRFERIARVDGAELADEATRVVKATTNKVCFVADRCE